MCLVDSAMYWLIRHSFLDAAAFFLRALALTARSWSDSILMENLVGSTCMNTNLHACASITDSEETASGCVPCQARPAIRLTSQTEEMATSRTAGVAATTARPCRHSEMVHMSSATAIECPPHRRCSRHDPWPSALDTACH